MASSAYQPGGETENIAGMKIRKTGGMKNRKYRMK
jgi:hypothetical protein